MGEVWQSENGKSLLFSVLVKYENVDTSSLFLLNALTALSVINAFESYKMDGLSIKWPNDILSYNKKIGGILIENMFKSSGEIHAVVGIGLNFYRIDFVHLSHASSLYDAYAKMIEREEVMIKILEYIQKNMPELID